MVNVENVLRVADAIEKHEIPWLGFNVQYWFLKNAPGYDKSTHNCGTVACIGGWTDIIRMGIEDNDHVSETTLTAHPESETGAWLGLDDEQSEHLFYPDLGFPRWSTVTPADAVAVLRHLAATGEVDWSVAPSEAAA